MAELSPNFVLSKIESWADRLPYTNFHIEIELPGKTYTLDKAKSRPVGFCLPTDENGGAVSK